MPEKSVDPYVPPASGLAAPDDLPRTKRLKDPRLRAHLCCWPYGIAALLDPIHQLLGVGGYTAVPAWQKFMGQTLNGARTSAALFFFCWVYRVAWNARKLAPPGATVEPAGIVGTFFIPFFNLVAPWRQMKRIARISSGPAMETHVNVWWTTVMIAYLIPFHFLAIIPAIEDHLPDSLHASTLVRYWDYPLLSTLPFLFVAISGITMVIRLTRAQVRRDAR
jgi:hypothetical protein